MLNEKTRQALQRGEYVTCDCFQEMSEDARKKFAVSGVPPKLVFPVAEMLGTSTLHYYRFIPEKGRYSTRADSGCAVSRKWTHCPFCGKPLRKATERDQLFIRLK